MKQLLQSLQDNVSNNVARVPFSISPFHKLFVLNFSRWKVTTPQPRLLTLDIVPPRHQRSPVREGVTVHLGKDPQRKRDQDQNLRRAERKLNEKNVVEVAVPLMEPARVPRNRNETFQKTCGHYKILESWGHIKSRKNIHKSNNDETTKLEGHSLSCLSFFCDSWLNQVTYSIRPRRQQI